MPSARTSGVTISKPLRPPFVWARSTTSWSASYTPVASTSVHRTSGSRASPAGSVRSTGTVSRLVSMTSFAAARWTARPHCHCESRAQTTITTTPASVRRTQRGVNTNRYRCNTPLTLDPA